MTTADTLSKLYPAAGAFLPHLGAAMQRYSIVGPQVVAAFLANVAHESAGFTRLEEGFNYNADALARVWPTRFRAPDGKPNALALTLARRPEAIANVVYAGRMGNGDEASGDGWRHRGAGLIQLTGLTNQLACGQAHGVSLADVPAWLRTPAGAALSAGWFWDSRALSPLAARGDFDGVCDIINRGRKTSADGDAIGYAERRRIYDKLLGGNT